VPWDPRRDEPGVTIAGGDTKVVEHGKGRFHVYPNRHWTPIHVLKIDPKTVRAGDRSALWPIGDHGITILYAGESIWKPTSVRYSSVLPLVDAMAHEAGPGIRWMRDPTRWAWPTSLNELARDCDRHCSHGKAIPVRDACAAPVNC